jgi:hypothetical protein
VTNRVLRKCKACKIYSTCFIGKNISPPNINDNWTVHGCLKNAYKVETTWMWQCFHRLRFIIIFYDKVLIYNLYYFLIYFFKWKLFELKTYINLYYILFYFYKINEDKDIQTRNCLIINVLMLCQKIILI